MKTSEFQIMTLMIAFGAASNAMGGSTLVNFDVYPDGSPVQAGDQFIDQWAGVGVLFSNGSNGAAAPSGNQCSLSPPNHAAANGLIVATFVDPCGGELSVTDSVTIYQDWCWAPGEGIDVYAYDAQGAEIGHQFASGGGTFVSFNFRSPVIARVHIFHILQGIDDFSFNTPEPVVDACPADIAGINESVDVDDLLQVINNWGACGLGICEADITCNRVVDVDDLLAVINAWGACE
jgi:hypothetical protein